MDHQQHRHPRRQDVAPKQTPPVENDPSPRCCPHKQIEAESRSSAIAAQDNPGISSQRTREVAIRHAHQAAQPPEMPEHGNEHRRLDRVCVNKKEFRRQYLPCPNEAPTPNNKAVVGTYHQQRCDTEPESNEPLSLLFGAGSPRSGPTPVQRPEIQAQPPPTVLPRREPRGHDERLGTGLAKVAEHPDDESELGGQLTVETNAAAVMNQRPPSQRCDCGRSNGVESKVHSPRRQSQNLSDPAEKPLDEMPVKVRGGERLENRQFVEDAIHRRLTPARKRFLSFRFKLVVEITHETNHRSREFRVSCAISRKYADGGLEETSTAQANRFVGHGSRDAGL